MITPIRRQPVPLECATPPGPARPRTSKSGPARPGRTSGIAPALLAPDALLASPRPRSPRTHFWHRLRPHAAPSPPRRSPAPEPHPDEKDSFCGRFAGLRPVVLRERVFQSNAHLPSARSRRIRGVPAGPGDGRDPRDRPGRRDPPQAALPRARRGHGDRYGHGHGGACAPTGPEGSSGRAPGPARLSRRAPDPPPDPRTPSPADPRTLAVKICHKDPDRAGTRQKKR